MQRSVLFTSLALYCLAENKVYRQKWHDLDTRPLPQWYESAKIGILIHWGLYSVPGYPKPGPKSEGAELIWRRWVDDEPGVDDYMTKKYGAFSTYQDFADMFSDAYFNPDEWAELFQKSGANYVILTAKHHDGFALFPSHNTTSWNSVKTGPKKDLVKAVSVAVRKYGMKFGIYYSLFEWFNQFLLNDQSISFESTSYVDEVVGPDIMQLVNDYEPSVLWAAGDWYGDDKYWNSKAFLAWLYNESPVKDEIVVNDRWGNNGILCHHGDFFTCGDRYNPGYLLGHKWENVFSLDRKSWGFRNELTSSDILSLEDLIRTVVATVSYGGNALINIGPTGEGKIAKIFRDRLLQLGEWLNINGEAIYNSSPWFYQRDRYNEEVWYTCKKDRYDPTNPIDIPDKFDTVVGVYVIFFNWPENDLLMFRDLSSYLIRDVHTIEIIQGLGENINLEWSIVNNMVHVHLPRKHVVKSKHAVTLSVKVYGVGYDDFGNSTSS